MPPIAGSSGAELREIFNINGFLTRKKSTRPNTFIYKLVETTMFANFIEIQFLGGSEKQELLYFSKLMNEERTKTNQTVLKPFLPSKTTRALTVNTDGTTESGSF